MDGGAIGTDSSTLLRFFGNDFIKARLPMLGYTTLHQQLDSKRAFRDDRSDARNDSLLNYE
jgi:hypothetical protein